MFALFHSYLCGRNAAEWLIQMDKRLEFDAIVCGEMKKKTTKEWTEIFENREIWYSPVNEYFSDFIYRQAVQSRII